MRDRNIETDAYKRAIEAERQILQDILTLS